jgi:cytosine/adenosine deaminase-related metal-dependent hydrolase
MHDTVIRGARVVDGTGAPAFYADIAVEGDTIAAIGGGLFGRREIAADGLTATPGQIDIHNHSDLRIWDAPEAKNYLHQGVTTMLGQLRHLLCPHLGAGSPAAGRDCSARRTREALSKATTCDAVATAIRARREQETRS